MENNENKNYREEYINSRMEELKAYRLEKEIFSKIGDLPGNVRDELNSRLKLRPEGWYELYDNSGVYEGTVHGADEIISVINSIAKEHDTGNPITAGGDFSADKLYEIARFGTRKELERFVYHAGKMGVTLEIKKGTIADATKENSDFLIAGIMEQQKEDRTHADTHEQMTDEEYAQVKKDLGFK